MTTPDAAPDAAPNASGSGSSADHAGLAKRGAKRVRTRCVDIADAHPQDLADVDQWRLQPADCRGGLVACTRDGLTVQGPRAARLGEAPQTVDACLVPTFLSIEASDDLQFTMTPHTSDLLCLRQMPTSKKAGARHVSTHPIRYLLRSCSSLTDLRLSVADDGDKLSRRGLELVVAAIEAAAQAGAPLHRVAVAAAGDIDARNRTGWFDATQLVDAIEPFTGLFADARLACCTLTHARVRCASGSLRDLELGTGLGWWSVQAAAALCAFVARSKLRDLTLTYSSLLPRAGSMGGEPTPDANRARARLFEAVRLGGTVQTLTIQEDQAREADVVEADAWFPSTCDAHQLARIVEAGTLTRLSLDAPLGLDAFHLFLRAAATRPRGGGGRRRPIALYLDPLTVTPQSLALVLDAPWLTSISRFPSKNDPHSWMNMCRTLHAVCRSIHQSRCAFLWTEDACAL